MDGGRGKGRGGQAGQAEEETTQVRHPFRSRQHESLADPLNSQALRSPKAEGTASSLGSCPSVGEDRSQLMATHCDTRWSSCSGNA